jgi:hypothetical protein
MDRRLQVRYVTLVQTHMHTAPKLAAGIASLPGPGSAFAATQGAWRFLNNERVLLSALAEPLREVGRTRTEASRAAFVMLAHDWCKLRFNQQRRKRDLTQLTHKTDIGYELTTSLLIDADDGSPLAPMEMRLKTAAGVFSTRASAVRDVHHLQQLLPTMRASLGWGLSKPIVHVIDREADSVDCYRQWHRASQKFLVRADDRRVRCHGKSCMLSAIAKQMQQDDHLRKVAAASYQGRNADLWVAETEVVLYRPAKKNVAGRKFEKAGQPLPLRLVVAQLRNAQNAVLAQWLLLSNVPLAWAATEHLARCYYWRWRIESFFKLLKSHGQQLEQWQQETGAAIARRLLVAAMACVVAWQLQANDSPAAVEFKNILVRLSGRQTKRRRPHTAPALLAGLWVLLSMLAMLEHYDLQHLKRLAAKIPYLRTG